MRPSKCQPQSTFFLSVWKWTKTQMLSDALVAAVYGPIRGQF